MYIRIRVKGSSSLSVSVKFVKCFRSFRCFTCVHGVALLKPGHYARWFCKSFGISDVWFDWSDLTIMNRIKLALFVSCPWQLLQG